jgi:hypothetical protein
LLIYTKEQQKFIESIDKAENVNFLFNSEDIIIIPADEGFMMMAAFLLYLVLIVYAI